MVDVKPDSQHHNEPIQLDIQLDIQAVFNCQQISKIGSVAVGTFRGMSLQNIFNS